MHFARSVPILYSSDVARSLAYYRDIFGFDQVWDWGDPPTFGGAGKDNVEVFFCKEDQGRPGTWLSVFVSDVDALYDRIVQNGGNVLVPPTDRPWNVREMLVEDPDQHKIRFGSGIQFGHERQPLSAPVDILDRKPTVEEQDMLVEAVGWKNDREPVKAARLDAAVFGVVAQYEGKIVGCALVTSDGAGLYYIKNVIVLPAFQSNHIGVALMQAVTRWLDANAVADATVVLYTGANLSAFYSRFGFSPMFGMMRKMAPDRLP